MLMLFRQRVRAVVATVGFREIELVVPVQTQLGAVQAHVWVQMYPWSEKDARDRIGPVVGQILGVECKQCGWYYNRYKDRNATRRKEQFTAHLRTNSVLCELLKACSVRLNKAYINIAPA